MFIYKITNIISGSIYIGKTSKTIEERFKIHIRNSNTKRNSALYDAIRKYGTEVFICELLEEVETQQSDEKEKYWVQYYKSNIKGIGYNLTDGGGGGNTLKYHPQREQIYKKQAESRRITFSKMSKEKKKLWGQHIAESSKGKIISQKQRQEVSERNLKLFADPEWKQKWLEQNNKVNRKGENHPMYGKNHTEETKQKISDFFTGKCFLSAQEKQKRSQKWKKQGNPNYKEIDILELIQKCKEMPNRGQLAEYFKVSLPTITKKIQEYLKINSFKHLHDLLQNNEFDEYVKGEKNELSNN